MSDRQEPARMAFRLRLPATSANLGAGFDAAAVALNFFLDIEAVPAQEFSIAATGRDADRCGRIDENLVLETYKAILHENGRSVIPLAIRMHNAIPLGMGCGSSAAGRLAAIALAVHFGELNWNVQRILDEASKLEGHPDNVSACWLGGFVTAAVRNGHTQWARCIPPEEWRVLVVVPADPLPTSKARAVLPESYKREDVVANLQAAAILGLAFAQGRGDLLASAMADRIHQPFRAPYCPLLPLTLPMVGTNGILGVALSGAGPAVLVVVENDEMLADACAAIQEALNLAALDAEFIHCGFSEIGAGESISSD